MMIGVRSGPVNTRPNGATPAGGGPGVSLQRVARYLIANPRRLFEAFDGG